MHIAQGFVRRIGTSGGGAKFLATFTVNDTHFTLGGIFVSGVPHFSCRNAKLKYDSLAQLTSTRLVEGSIGPNNLALRFLNGPTIEGILESPYDPPSRVRCSSKEACCNTRHALTGLHNKKVKIRWEIREARLVEFERNSRDYR
ncbi:hypothetical protein M413DRAFT_59783 [Hebeloma cylindrosporum]|uniref:Uncharacterized protein n=1 Tax=Hebeloma cylindrosporum TaxID=76867 RepID=A0A0C3CWJ8_HEBCY|nr:hypothetical protein M413DRAFT_59783 [Hebeloma cylindrosporum h7]